MDSENFAPDRRRQWNLGIPVASIVIALILTLAMPAWDPIDTDGKLAIFIGCFCLFSVMAGLGMWGMYLSRTVVQTDPEGLTRRLGGKAERVHWDDIVGARSGNTDGTHWTLSCRDGRTIKLELSFIEDREILKALLQTRRNALPAAQVESFRMENRWLFGPILAVTGAGLLGLAVLGDFAAINPQIRPSDAAVLPWFGGAMGAFLLLMALVYGTSRYRVMGDRLVKTSCFGSKVIVMALVNEVTLSNSSGTSRRSPVEYMKLSYDGRTHVVSSNFADFPILRDRLLGLAPQAKIVDRRTMKV